ncbi:MAG: AMP-binding protein [Alphaproteobacteria bacterium]|nr:AMP-binding protein [Alphaproteobacteria bacterium]MBU1549396.1 AMP-binding protein [Alphaproteobacteria bacterium]MBU2338161.1 AMP-binding protein [Alphaproteobacteria bacterium]MBU2387548.1 AMP-binding protein [Alphaproteobacteria bacterium]
MSNYNLADGFFRSTSRHAGRPFYCDIAREVSYGEMGKVVQHLAGFLSKNGRPRRVGILATRSFEAYAGILAAGFAGAAYVPINLKWPEQRIVALLQLMELDAMVVDVNGAALLTPAVLAVAPDSVVIANAASGVEGRNGQQIVRLGDMQAEPLRQPVTVAAEDLGYIIFTSGTTGLPKGVMISAGALASYLKESRPWTNLVPEDRLAETCDVSFDLTVHNLFLCTEAGASLHMLSALEMMAPARFIRARAITVWMSVPTLVAVMRRNGVLRPGVFPSLRLSIFCGEPLPVSAAQVWAAAASNGVVENIYGPTEGTVICLRQQLTVPPIETAGRGILAIGTPYESMDVAIFDSEHNSLPNGIPGEIALSGPQLAMGYLDAPEQTADRFRVIRDRRWYLTGDLGVRDERGIFHHLGRTDNQVKVKGNRIELEEVEANLRQAAETDTVAVVAWPMVDGSAQGLVGFCCSRHSGAAISAALLATLPRYMVPSPIEVLDSLPVNINGKVDRRALFARLEETRLSNGRPVWMRAATKAKSGGAG